MLTVVLAVAVVGTALLAAAVLTGNPVIAVAVIAIAVVGLVLLGREWLADKGVIQKVSAPARLHEKSRVVVDEAAYYYDGDRKAGQILCQGVLEFGGYWRVVKPNGAPVK